MDDVIRTFHQLLPDFVSEVSERIVQAGVPIYADLPRNLVQDALYTAIRSLGQDLQEGTTTAYTGYWQAVALQRAHQGISPAHSMQVTYLSTEVMTSDIKQRLGDQAQALAWWLERMHTIILLGMQVMTEARIAAMRQIGVLPLISVASLPTAEPLYIRMLGDFTIQRGTTPLTQWERRSAHYLLALFATFHGQWMQREEICELLWPDIEPPNALNRFKVAMHALQTTLEPQRMRRDASSYVQRQESRYRLNPDPALIFVDSFQFECDLERAFALPDGQAKITAYEQALSRYAGILLPSCVYVDWTIAARERLALRFVQSASTLAQLYLHANQPDLAAHWAGIALRHDDLWDDAYVTQIHAYLRLGQQLQAQRVFEHYRHILGEMGLTPTPEVAALLR